MKIVLAQLNSRIGDLEFNVQKLLQWSQKAHQSGCDLVVFPELFLCGYPPKDLLLQRGFLEAVWQKVLFIQEQSRQWPGLGILFGAPVKKNNSVVLISDGEVVGIQAKSLLPNYDIFDERRWFEPADHTQPIVFKGMKLGVLVCEDAWGKANRYGLDPAQVLADQGAEILIALTASPYEVTKPQRRLAAFQDICKRTRLPLYVVNQVGAQDSLIFDGGSLILNPQAELMALAPSFQECLLGGDDGVSFAPNVVDALVLGIRDYVYKNGFQRVVLGLSGGIDSSVVAALAALALGVENVTGLLMPSPFSSAHSVEDATTLAMALGISTEIYPISDLFSQYQKTLHLPSDTITLPQENLQARIRGNLLMAYAGENQALVLSTGNKSELAVGYCTLYGDMCGALAVIGDVWKTQVYELARELNQRLNCIPESVFTKPPSAELRPDQIDQDSLPDYAILDAILLRYIEQRESVDQIVRAGFDVHVVNRLVQLVAKSEHKRAQAAPVLKVSSVAFGDGRRMVISGKL